MGNSQPNIEIYTLQTCPYCIKAKELLRKKGVSFTEISIDDDEAVKQKMIARTGGPKSVPQIFVNNVFIPGGCDGLHKLDAKGELDGILGLK